MRVSKLPMPRLAHSATRTTRHTSTFSSRKAPLVEVHDQFLQLMSAPTVPSSGRVLFGVDQRVASITLDNANKKGAVDAKMFLDLARAVDAVESLCESGEVGGIVLKGGGGAFCAGLDLDLATRVINTPSRGILMCDYMTDALNRIRDCAAVSVCLINGAAIGGGSEIISCSDYRIMLATGARIQSVHARIGAAPGWGGTTRLAQLVGKREALRLLGSSHSLDAEEALRIGLVDEIVPQGEDGDAAALRLLEPFLSSKQSSKSVAGIKYTLSAADPEEMIIREGEVFYHRWFSKENIDAIKKARK